MHELSLAVEVADIVERAVREHGLVTVDRLSLTVGELAGVEKPALDLALASALAGTAAAGAAVVYVDEAGEGECPYCGAAGAVHQLYDPCAVCGRPGVKVLRGRSLKVKAIEGR